MPVLDPKELIRNRVEAIKVYHEGAGVKRAQLDVSGGVDSAVMLGLLARAVGPENITAVYSGIHSSTDSSKRANRTANAFGVRLVRIDLTDVFRRLLNDMRKSLEWAGFSPLAIDTLIAEDPTVLGSIRSTLRAPVGRGFNRMTGGGIRHGTGNECEDRWLRFYQKGGDGEVDTNPMAMLSKGEVYQLGLALGVPGSVLSAVPSPDLHNNAEAHNDEDELEALYGVPFTYSQVNLEGEYTRVGTIERVSRLMDLTDISQGVNLHYLEKIFPPDQIPFGEALALCTKAARIDRQTYHKYNPNCPTLGDREQLVRAGILTNTLPIIKP